MADDAAWTASEFAADHVSNGAGAPVEMRRIAMPDGVRLRVAVWPKPERARGTALVLTGRAEFIEKYAETAGALTARGFRVVALDWRNQGLSDRPLPNRQIHHLTDFMTLVDDLDEVHRQVVAPVAAETGGPVILLAHSMGGLVTTLAMARHVDDDPGRYAAVLLAAPMYAIHSGLLPRWLVRVLASLGLACGWGARYALGQGDYDPAEGRFRLDNKITADPRRYAAFHSPFAERPQLRVGGVSFAWVAAALDAEEALRDGLPLERVRTPVLLLSAPGDRVVRAKVHRAVAARLGNAHLVEYPDARHELLMECDVIRDRVWADIDAFLDRTLQHKTLAPADGSVVG
ncbi:lysophospholipase [Azospirillum sp. TSH100]|uniref:alpha/beta hydrolase n=1 Tax=Azospirillum sp. TSH100 TaxID=652764 RepID=UPI000D60F259|nr:alpha/beta hydrolase [Azospirillum sp. TSH100]PWC83985.1 lysophospholipase [Azospirillum sp. TSH100]QCG87509.1 alpha/beta hydrolase [Azospirillum sp. TSH100]